MTGVRERRTTNHTASHSGPPSFSKPTADTTNAWKAATEQAPPLLCCMSVVGFSLLATKAQEWDFWAMEISQHSGVHF